MLKYIQDYNLFSLIYFSSFAANILLIAYDKNKSVFKLTLVSYLPIFLIQFFVYNVAKLHCCSLIKLILFNIIILISFVIIFKIILKFNIRQFINVCIVNMVLSEIFVLYVKYFLHIENIAQASFAIILVYLFISLAILILFIKLKTNLSLLSLIILGVVDQYNNEYFFRLNACLFELDYNDPNILLRLRPTYFYYTIIIIYSLYLIKNYFGKRIKNND